MKFVILRNLTDDFYKRWVISCEKRNVDYEIVNIFDSNWLEKIRVINPDIILLRPPCEVEKEKNIYDERIYLIAKILKKFTYPSYEEITFYENKRYLSSYLEVNQIPHPTTRVFCSKKEAFDFIENCNLPLVSKTSIGASGSGVKIIKSKSQAEEYVKKAFSKKGIKLRFGPNRVNGNPRKWTKKAISDPAYFVKKVKNYIRRNNNAQRDFVIFQDYISHEFEWRAVKIGDSYFAHKKIKQGEMASGTKGIDYVTPPVKLLDFVRRWSDKLNFNSMAFDVFEDENGDYLVNELQTIFGHVQDYICSVNGNPGRYSFQNGNWIFEEGDFNTNESYDLRLENAINLYNEKK